MSLDELSSPASARGNGIYDQADGSDRDLETVEGRLLFLVPTSR